MNSFTLFMRTIKFTTLAVVSLVVLANLGCAPVESDTLSEGQEETPQTVETPQPAPTDDANSMPSLSLGQQLPVSAVAEISGQEILLEVARTPRQQAMGLMYRDALPDHRGMLFPMGRPRPVNFWMKNVPVPLDMVFIYNGTVRAIMANVPPCEADPCPTYGPGDQLVDSVIELRGGHAAELGLMEGSAVVISPVNP